MPSLASAQTGASTTAPPTAQLIGDHLAGIGYFRGRKPANVGVADVLSWNAPTPYVQLGFPVFLQACDTNVSANQLCISESGMQTSVRYRCDMR